MTKRGIFLIDRSAATCPLIPSLMNSEFLKEHQTVQAQQKEIDALRAELKEERALIQRVNDKVELNRPAPQTVANNQ